MMKELYNVVICLGYVHVLRRLDTPIVERPFQQNFNYGKPWFHEIMFSAKYEMDDISRDLNKPNVLTLRRRQRKYFLSSVGAKIHDAKMIYRIKKRCQGEIEFYIDYTKIKRS